MGCENHLGKTLKSYSDALTAILECGAVRELSTEQVPLEQSIGRTCAATLRAEHPVPEFPNSAMDGFALISEQTMLARPDHPVLFNVVGSIAAGDLGVLHPQPEGAWEIMTGAPVPAGYDAVIKLEDVDQVLDSEGRVEAIKVFRPVSEGENYRDAGEDFQVGDLITEQGLILGAEQVLALATFGHPKIEVKRKPRIAILSTGKEIVPVGTALAYGQIWNSTGPFLHSSLSALGADVKSYGIVADQPQTFIEKIKMILSEPVDVVITTGAVSVGKYDFVADALKEIGVNIRFSKVAIRPGKPILFGELNPGPVFFGLPGNPVSTAVGLRFFVQPYLERLSGQAQEKSGLARLVNAQNKPEGFTVFYKAKIDRDDPKALILPGQSSFMVSPLLKANAWVKLSQGQARTESNTEVEFFPMKRGNP